MATYANSGLVPVKVMYKVEGVQYGSADNQVPFDEVIVTPGQSVDLGNASIIKTIDLDPAVAARVFVGAPTGAAGEIVNRGPHTLRVDYHITGVSYGPITDAYDGSQRGPWDEAFLPIGSAFIGGPDVKVLKTVSLSGESVTVPPINYLN